MCCFGAELVSMLIEKMSLKPALKFCLLPRCKSRVLMTSCRGAMSSSSEIKLQSYSKERHPIQLTQVTCDKSLNTFTLTLGHMEYVHYRQKICLLAMKLKM